MTWETRTVNQFNQRWNLLHKNCVLQFFFCVCVWSKGIMNSIVEDHNPDFVKCYRHWRANFWMLSNLFLNIPSIFIEKNIIFAKGNNYFPAFARIRISLTLLIMLYNTGCKLTPAIYMYGFIWLHSILKYFKISFWHLKIV